MSVSQPDPDMDLIRSLPAQQLVETVKLAGWAIKGLEEFGLELVYADGELLAFRRTAKKERQAV